jgi:hypothetical protein
MGGEIQVSSELGLGSEFKVSLITEMLDLKPPKTMVSFININRLGEKF